MSSCQLVRIGEFCTIGSGSTPSREKAERYFRHGRIPWVKSGELRETVIVDTEEHVTEVALEETSVKLIPAGALLLAMYGATVGRLGILGVEATTNQAVCHLIPDPKSADVRYLFHALQARVEQIVARGVGGAQPNISQGVVKDLLVPLPVLAEQRRIAAILDKADELRAKRRAALIQLDKLTESLFVDLFGDPAMNSKGWPVQPFESEITSVRYGTGSPPEYVSEGHPFIRATNVKAGTISPKDLKRVPQSEAERLEKCKIRSGDLIIVRSGVNTGDCALIPPEYDKAYAAFDLVVQLPFSSAVFYNFLINSQYGKRVLAPLTRRAAQPHLNAEQLKSLQFISPPKRLRERFADGVAVIEKMKLKHRLSLTELGRLFLSLQHRAFRGEL